ncbi:MAG TPA: flagellin [Stellaceae bacterium]|nr:flagellin [Stellaceae bacterium]
MPVSSLAEVQQVIQNLAQLQTQGNTLQQQISTGLVSQTYAGIAPHASQLVDLTAQQSQQQGYIDTINTVNTQLQSMSLATSTITTLVQQFTTQLESNAYNQAGATTQSQAKALLAEIGNYLNTSNGEGYLFSGSATSTPPFNAAGLPNPGDLTTPVSGAPPSGYYQGDGTIAQAQVDSGNTLQYGVTANNPAFEQVVRVLNFLANSPPPNPNNSTDVANINQAEQMLTTATTSLQQLTSNIGLNQSQLNTMLQTHQSALTLVKSNIGDITNADPATVITQLDALQTQMTASYQTINILQNLSLANYLK